MQNTIIGAGPVVYQANPSSVVLASHIGRLVSVLKAPLLNQLPAYDLEK